MAINRDKVDLWKKDVEESVDFFNSWFLSFAPRTFKTARNKACEQVDAVFEATNDVREITAPLLVMAPLLVRAAPSSMVRVTPSGMIRVCPSPTVRVFPAGIVKSAEGVTEAP